MNNGTTALTNLGFSNGAELANNGGITIDTGLWVSSNSIAMLDGTIDCDSFLLEGDITLNSGATLTGGDLYASGTMDISGVLQVDSLLNDGTFTVQGGATVYAFDLSSNSGTISDSIDICDPSAGAGVVDSNLGTIAGTVTACATNCFVGVDDPKVVELSIYPNPAQQELMVSGFHGTVSIHDLTGRVVIQRMVQGQESIDVEALTNGVYVLRAGDQTLRFVKN